MHRIALQLAPLALAACASEAAAPPSPTVEISTPAAPSATATPEAQPVATPRDDDDAATARQAELQKVALEIQAQIEQLRGAKFREPVAVKVSDKASLVSYLKRRMDIESSPERQRFIEEEAKLLGLIPPDMNLMAATQGFLESQVGGFYDPPSKTFYVMDGFDGDLARVIMSHEFVHALDDQLWDLDATIKRLGEDTDRISAFAAVCEGSGTLTMTQWTMAHGAKLDLKALAELSKMTSQGMEDLPPFIWKGALAAYLCGQSFLEKSVPRKSKKKAAEESKEAEADAAPVTYAQQLERAFQDPPRSTEQILHPQKYWSKEKDEPVSIRFDTSALPQGWKVRGEDTLGELALAMVTEPRAERKGIKADDMFAVLGLKYTNAAAEGWGGDRLIVLERGDERVLELVTAWDTPEDAREFATAIEESGEGARIPVKPAGAVSKTYLAPCSVDIEESRSGEIACVVVRVRALLDAQDARASEVSVPWTATK